MRERQFHSRHEWPLGSRIREPFANSPAAGKNREGLFQSPGSPLSTLYVLRQGESLLLLLLSGSHILTVPSAEQEARRFFKGLNAKPQTASE